MQGPLHKSLSTTRQYLDCNYRSPGSIEHAAIGSRISSPISRRSRQQRLCSNYVISWMDNAEHAPQLRRSQAEVACPAASCAILLDRRRSEDRTGLKGGKFSSPVPFVALEQSEELAFPMNRRAVRKRFNTTNHAANLLEVLPAGDAGAIRELRALTRNRSVPALFRKGASCCARRGGTEVAMRPWDTIGESEGAGRGETPGSESAGIAQLVEQRFCKP
jgi:hypothetical protein